MQKQIVAFGIVVLLALSFLPMLFVRHYLNSIVDDIACSRYSEMELTTDKPMAYQEILSNPVYKIGDAVYVFDFTHIPTDSPNL